MPDTGPLLEIGFSTFSASSLCVFFTFLILSFGIQKVLVLVKSNLPVFSFVAHSFGVISTLSFKIFLSIPLLLSVAMLFCIYSVPSPRLSTLFIYIVPFNSQTIQCDGYYY